MLKDRFLKRLGKKARKGLRGWPIATIAFYGPNLSQATKIAVGIVPSENASVEDGAMAGRFHQSKARPPRGKIRIKNEDEQSTPQAVSASPDLASVRPMPIKPPASSYVWGHGGRPQPPSGPRDLRCRQGRPRSGRPTPRRRSVRGSRHIPACAAR